MRCVATAHSVTVRNLEDSSHTGVAPNIHALSEGVRRAMPLRAGAIT